MSRAETEFDAMVMAAFNEEWHVPLAAQASPDGLRSGTGRWRVYHNCPAPDVHAIDDGLLRCSGCGQTYHYAAEVSQEGKER